MNSILKQKLLQHLSARRVVGGFTLIELLVVVIIVGILAAVALPNLLGQVGRAREVEGKNAVGAILRAEQAYHFENTAFVSIAAGAITTNNELGITLQLDFYEPPAVEVVAAGPTEAAFLSIANTQAVAEGTRQFSGRIEFQNNDGAYGQLVCQTNTSAVIAQAPVATGSGATCPVDHIPVVSLGNS